MTDQKEYWLHIDQWNEEVRYDECPPPPQDRFVLHIWIIDEEFEETRT